MLLPPRIIHQHRQPRHTFPPHERPLHQIQAIKMHRHLRILILPREPCYLPRKDVQRLARVHDHPAVDTTRVPAHPELEPGDDAEGAAAAAQRPE